MNHSQVVIKPETSLSFEHIYNYRFPRTPQPIPKQLLPQMLTNVKNEIERLSNRIMLLSVQNADKRNKCNQLEANLEAITRALNNNIDDTTAIVSSIQKENEILKQEIERKRMLIDEIQEIRNQEELFFANCVDTQDFLNRCVELKTRLMKARKIHEAANSINSENHVLVGLRRKLSALKQKNVAEQTKLATQILALSKEKDRLQFHLSC